MFYHVYSRGVDKRPTFQSSKEFKRFHKQLDEFRFEKSDPTLQSVQVHCYALLNNHFHLLVEELVPDGISRFMQRLGTGYTLFFNKRNERNGPLFSGTYKRKLITSEEYLSHLAVYLHANPLSLISPNWRTAKDSAQDLINKLCHYQWSSLRDWVNSFNGFCPLDTTLFGSLENHLELLHGYVIGCRMLQLNGGFEVEPPLC